MKYMGLWKFSLPCDRIIFVLIIGITNFSKQFAKNIKEMPLPPFVRMADRAC